MKTQRTLRLQSRNYLKLQQSTVAKDRNARNFRQMAFAAKVVYDRKLHLSYDENKILRQSLQNFAAVCYKQRTELTKLKIQLQNRDLRSSRRRYNLKSSV